MTRSGSLAGSEPSAGLVLAAADRLRSDAALLCSCTQGSCALWLPPAPLLQHLLPACSTFLPANTPCCCFMMFFSARMQVLMTKPTDLKSAMQAISNGGSAEMARLLLKATREKQIKDKEEERREW